MGCGPRARPSDHGLMQRSGVWRCGNPRSGRTPVESQRLHLVGRRAFPRLSGAGFLTSVARFSTRLSTDTPGR